MWAIESSRSVLLPHIAGVVAVGGAGDGRDIGEAFAPGVSALEAESRENCFLTVACKLSYLATPWYSVPCKPLGWKPRYGTRALVLNGELVVTPLMGLVGLAN